MAILVEISHQTGVQFTIFASHTIEFTNQTREERPLQKMNKHALTFQLEASVRCQVSGIEAEVKAKREKTVNTWLTAVIFESSSKQRGRSAQWSQQRELYALCVCVLDNERSRWFR